MEDRNQYELQEAGLWGGGAQNDQPSLAKTKDQSLSFSHFINLLSPLHSQNSYQ